MSIFGFEFHCISRLMGRSATGAVLSVLAASALADTPIPTVNVPASATVVMPLTVTSISTLNFGAFAPDSGLSSGSGTVTIPTTGPRSSTTNVKLMPANSGGPATVAVMGSPEMQVSLGKLPAAVLLSGPVGNTMKLYDLKDNLALMPQISFAGTLQFQIGGTLEVGASQLPGIYSGQVPITLSYN